MGGRTKAILAVGGPTGDVDPTTDPLPPEHIPDAHRGVHLARTPDERGPTRRARPLT
ncbi:hypothetical protein ABZS96_21320 [Streptomyces avermitilis]|uniref:hypothetical protein n=1 Tax=Streptomyces avermitilis TaxID=33903 RepID=UPI0033A8777E